MSTTPVNPLTTSIEGPAPAMEIAVDMAKRAKWLVPLAAVVGGFWGVEGIASVGYAVVVVVATTGRISFALMAGAALFGYLLRLGLIFGAVMLVRNASWVEMVPLGIMLIVTHLGLLFWELKYVSGSFAYPGLKPKPVSATSDVDHAAAEAA